MDDTEGLTGRTTPNGTFYLSHERQKSKNPNWKLVIVVAVLSFVVGLPVVIYMSVTSKSAPPAPDSGGIVFPVSNSPLGVYRFASVAADAGRCSQIGTKMLALGGTAVDAAIASCLCTGIFNIHNAGIGGGFFMTIWHQKSQKAFAVDAREIAPTFATEDMFVGKGNASVMGPLSIAVPGEIAGYWEVHKKFGRLNWETLFEPTIELCNNGVEVSEVLESAVEQMVGKINDTMDKTPYETMLNFLINPANVAFYKKGDVIKCPVLAQTLSRIAKLGAPAFYNGSIADDIIADLRDIGSPISRSDLSAYSVVWRKPLDTLIQNKHRLISLPPPSSGPVLTLILNILSGYNFTKSDSQEMVSYHRFIEALKFGYGRRMLLGDENFVDGMSKLVANLTSPSYGDYMRSLINDSQTQPTSFYLPNGLQKDNHGTSHISVVDAEGNAVSITSTINVYFGSGILGKRTGIVFNNEMDDFSTPNATNYFNLPPSPENFIKPGKRPQSSMCPGVFLVRDNSTDNYKVSLVLGAAGGSRIPSGTAYIATRLLWFDDNPKQAVDALRFHHQLTPEMLYFEPEMPVKLLNWLKQRGHVNQTEYKYRDSIMSVAQVVQLLQNGTILANSDYRKNAFPDGF